MGGRTWKYWASSGPVFRYVIVSVDDKNCQWELLRRMSKRLNVVFPREYAKVRLGNNNSIIVSCPISASKMQRQNNVIATICKVSLTTFNSFGRISAHQTDTHGHTHLRAHARTLTQVKQKIIWHFSVRARKCAHLQIKFLAILQYTSLCSTNVEVNSGNLARDHFPRG